MLTIVKFALAVLVLTATCIGTSLAAPVKFEAIIASKADASLEFADGSKHVVRLVQREGVAKGQGPLSGTTLLEWAIHDMPLATGKADGYGYMVATKSPEDIAYLKIYWRGTLLKGDDSKVVPVLAGTWDVVGGTGVYKGLAGIGSLKINVLEGSNRQWLFDGDLTKP